MTLGALSEERLAPRLVELDIMTDQPSAGPRRLDYGEVVSLLERLQDGEFDYIEDLASRAAQLLASRWPAREWKLTVRKVRPPSPLPLGQAVYTLVRKPRR